MLAGRPKIEPVRRAEADSVRVTEIYLSVQGESTHAGKNMTQDTRQVDILRPACKELLRKRRGDWLH